MYEWLIAALSIAGGVLNVLKNRWGFVLWIAANLAWIVVDVVYGLWAQIPVWVVFTAISVWGFVKWSGDSGRGA